MTRETKIGLLVSLAFVIAVGVLLSDHMANNSDAKPASVVAIGPDVIKGLAVPGEPASGVAAPVKPDAEAIPVNQVPSVADVTALPGGVGKTSVIVGPPPAPTSQIKIEATPNIPQRTTQIMIAPPAGLAVADTGAHITTLDVVSSTPASPATFTSEPAEKNYQEYAAVAGDNVAKWARKFLGADTKANRDLIIAANDVLKKDPSKVVIGKTYRIPLKTAPAPAPVAVAAAPATQPVLPASAAAPAPAAPVKTYVVKSGDTLWKIANGDPQLVNEIRKLNRNALKGDTLKVGVTLRVPARNNES